MLKARPKYLPKIKLLFEVWMKQWRVKVWCLKKFRRIDYFPHLTHSNMVYICFWKRISTIAHWFRGIKSERLSILELFSFSKEFRERERERERKFIRNFENEKSSATVYWKRQRQSWRSSRLFTDQAANSCRHKKRQLHSGHETEF